MPKKRRSDGTGNVVPTDMPDRFQWTCRKCKPPAKVRAATRADLSASVALHKAMLHP